MKRLATLLSILFFPICSLMAQAPEKFTYQAVVRNANNALLSNAPVGIRVSILQGGVSGAIAYMETHTAVTNANGLVTIVIGGGNLQQGAMSDIQWGAGTVFLKTEIDPDGGSNYTITTTQQLLSVPYALYSQEAGNGFSGDYNDLTNAPTIPTVPTNVSAFTNDAGYLTSFTEQQVISISNDTIFLTGGSFVKLPEGFDGDYNSLINRPTIPTVPTNVSAFNNDVGYITMDSIPTNVSSFTNDAGYLTSFTEQQVLSISNDTISLTGGSFVKLPEGFDGDYNSLTNKPVIPTVPVEVSAFNNDAGYITIDSIPSNISAFSNDAQYITSADIPTNVSAFENDVPYLTSYTEQQVLTISNDTIFLTGGSFVKLPEGFDGDYNSLTNTPVIPTVPVEVSAFDNDAGYITMDSIPTNVSAFNNDVGYLTSFTEQQVLSISNDTIFLTGGSFVKLPEGFDGDYNSLTNKPVIPTVPVEVSAFDNDAGYITMDSIPTTVSSFTNDAGYLSDYTENQSLGDVTAIGNSAGSRQLKDVSDPTEAYDAVNLHTLNLKMDSLMAQFQQMQQQMQQEIDSLKDLVNTNHFDCGTDQLIDIDGNIYNTVQIGNQCWMKENLRTKHFVDGSAITEGGSAASISEPYYYESLTSDIPLSERGLHYNWSAVTYGATSCDCFPSSIRGVCPVGWHVPSDAEWLQLINYVGGNIQYVCGGDSSKIAKALASTTGWFSAYYDSCLVGYAPENNNATGFSAFPAGEFVGSIYQSTGRGANFWSRTANGNTAYCCYLCSMCSSMALSPVDKRYGYSVRCLRD